MSFTLCLHASVPKANSAPGLKHAADVPVQQSAAHGRTALALTAGPADTTFYEEFYPSDELRIDSQPNTGMLHRFTSMLKKAVKKVSFI